MVNKDYQKQINKRDQIARENKVS